MGTKTKKFSPNNVSFSEVEGCNYRNDYSKIFHDLNGMSSENIMNELRCLVLDDLFFILLFVLRIPIANHPFVVDRCQEVENGPISHTMDIWPRFHFKSTILTVASTVQRHLRYPERCTCILSYKKGLADKFLSAIKHAYESNFLKTLFPDVLYGNPYRDSSSWSIQNGIVLKRQGQSRQEKTIESAGLIDGMPQGSHFNDRNYDDIETEDMKYSQEQLDKAFAKFRMSLNLGTGLADDTERIEGTFYSHTGVLTQIQGLVDSDGVPIYTLRRHTCTEDDTLDGKPVFVTREKLESLKVGMGIDVFYSQMMCDPTPKFDMELDPSLLIKTEKSNLPDNLYKFMVIDSAGSHRGEKAQNRNDNWGIHVIGVDPEVDNIGASNIYILDSFIDKIDETAVVTLIANMYFRNSLIEVLAYERLGAVTPGWLLHLINILHNRGVYMSEATKNLHALKPSQLNKKSRITSTLRLPLLNGKIHYLDTIDSQYIDQLKKEMQLHPGWHDDGIDSLTNIYRVIDKYGIKWKTNTLPPEILFSQYSNNSSSNGWLGV